MTQPKLGQVDLELTNYCNLSCWMCPRKEMTRAVGFMDLALAGKIARELGELEVGLVNLHLFGETILHPQLREILTCLRTHNPRGHLKFSTNATYLNRARFELLAGLLDRLHVSIDGTSPESYAQHRVDGDLTRTLNNVADVLRYRRETSQPVPAFEIRMIEMGQTLADRRTFHDLFRDLLLPEDRILFKPLESFGGTIVQLGALRLDSCSYLDHALAVFWNGDVTTCCYDCHGKNIIGNLHHRTLKDVFLSARQDELRRLYHSGQLQKQEDLLCHTCLAADYHARDLAGGMDRLPPLRADDLMIEIEHPPEFGTGRIPVSLSVRLFSRLNVELRSRPPFPVHLCYRWLEEGGRVCLVDEGVRAPLRPPLRAGCSEVYRLPVVPPPNPGRYRLRVTLVQEGVAWFDNPPLGIFRDEFVTVP